ncbi:MAG: peptide chain release factor N(5)-glutamine methyltransferase [Chloroflexota bacterium]|nr:peptide chain release factor N(5)-glutamine methyltransferase [Chloroflexota bacterium]
MQISVRESILHAENLFSSHRIENARLEAELLAMYVLGVRRAELYVMMDEPLTKAEDFWCLERRRISNEPSAYITGHREFYGINFHVDPRALIPRPESELLVEKALEFASRFTTNNKKCLIADIGTGSGAIAISLAVNLYNAIVYAVDISEDALEVALHNCRELDVLDRVRVLYGDLLNPLPVSVDIIVANLPYIKDSDVKDLSPEIRFFEPSDALVGGSDGLDQVRRLLTQSAEILCPGGLLAFEIGEGQEDIAKTLAHEQFPEAQVDSVLDLGGIPRVVVVTT